MGAGRKTSTSSYDSAGGGNNRHRVPIPPDRDLRDELGGVIFGTTAQTIRGAWRAARACLCMPCAQQRLVLRAAPRAERSHSCAHLGLELVGELVLELGRLGRLRRPPIACRTLGARERAERSASAGLGGRKRASSAAACAASRSRRACTSSPFTEATVAARFDRACATVASTYAACAALAAACAANAASASRARASASSFSLHARERGARVAHDSRHFRGGPPLVARRPGRSGAGRAATGEHAPNLLRAPGHLLRHLQLLALRGGQVLAVEALDARRAAALVVVAHTRRLRQPHCLRVGQVPLAPLLLRLRRAGSGGVD